MKAFLKLKIVSSLLSPQNPVFYARHTLYSEWFIIEKVFSKLYQSQQRQTSKGSLCDNLREMTTKRSRIVGTSRFQLKFTRFKKILLQEKPCSSFCDQIHIKTLEYCTVRLVVLERHYDQMRQIITVDLSLHW